MCVIGIDLGATNITAAIMNEKGNILRELKTKTPNNEDSVSILKAVGDIVVLLQSSEFQITAVGIGTAGRIDKNKGEVTFSGGTIKNWKGTKIKSVLESKLGLPVFVDNDVNTAALGNSWLGTGSEFNHYAFVTLGTGLGGALVHDGKVVSSKYGGTGEFGHLILYPRGISCECGQKGCAENYVSGTALSSLAKEANPEWDSFELIEQYKIGNQIAKKIICKFVDDLSTVIISIQNMYDPEAIILGGGVMDTFTVWEDVLHMLLNENSNMKINVVTSSVGNNAGFIGAAKLAINGFLKNE